MICVLNVPSFWYHQLLEIWNFNLLLIYQFLAFFIKMLPFLLAWSFIINFRLTCLITNYSVWTVIWLCLWQSIEIYNLEWNNLLIRKPNNPASIYLIKVYDRETRKRCDVCSSIIKYRQQFEAIDTILASFSLILTIFHNLF